MFPFKFGIMFGDIGHGGLLLAFAIYLCFSSKTIAQNKGALYSVLPLRYLLLLMGIFAVYSGFIYNDFLSMPLKLFGTCWEAHGI
jgi:V-type H+-transporting ATPase subunit a